MIEFLALLLAQDQIKELNDDKIKLLSNTYMLDATRNSEIRFRYLRLCIKARLAHKMDDILAFANSNFRMKFVRSVYRDLGNWPEMKPIAVANFLKVKDQMMKVCAYTVAKDLGIDI